ncbi:MAG: PLP-dependent aminotransferase family protein, partial [Blautia sp.]|nr:PLP-dependent aminotransferase family protein [Blautia sp.]
MYRSEQGSRYLYMEVYEHYRGLILSEVLKSGDRMPSLRKASAELSRSRTTVESAYFQLAADGYIVARSRSGYYVTDIASARKSIDVSGREMPHGRENAHGSKPRYDFASSGVDRESFRFDLWQRYIKSALRQDDRLLSYGEPQGEEDFREALSAYVRDRRNILCSPDQIVVGAGVQTLLHLLCPLLKERHTVSFPTSSFVHGAAVFCDHGFDVHYRDKDADIIYVSPAHMNRLGDIMPVKRRMELIRYASSTGSVIIEDDYENEFVYLQKPTPSLYGLSREDNVVYIGSFSRLLLPSLRISFMILPFPLLEEYQKTAANYNQTASKAEQIALAQFIRDGHLTAQIRRLRRLYAAKQQHLSEAAVQIFGSGCKVRNAPSG